jgi:hypothetical protein
MGLGNPLGIFYHRFRRRIYCWIVYPSCDILFRFAQKAAEKSSTKRGFWAGVDREIDIRLVRVERHPSS